MAQKERYPESIMLDAIVKYSEEYSGIIKYTELAKWASKHISGLEGIKEHHFRAKRTRIKNGKKVKVNNLAFEKINENNEIRKAGNVIKHNILLYSADIDAFLREPVTEQRKHVMDARRKVEELIHENSILRSQNNLIQAENQALEQKLDGIMKLLDRTQKEQTKLDKKIRVLMKMVDEEQRRKVLQQAGIQDNGFDLKVYADSLQENIKDAFSISKTIQPFIEIIQENENDDGDTINTIIGGIL